MGILRPPNGNRGPRGACTYYIFPRSYERYSGRLGVKRNEYSMIPRKLGVVEVDLSARDWKMRKYNNNGYKKICERQGEK